MTVDYIEFSRQIKEKYPEYQDVDDLKLAKAMIEKYPEYTEQVSFETQQPIQKTGKPHKQKKLTNYLTPSSAFKGISEATASAIVAPFDMVKNGKTFKDSFDSSMQKVEEGWKNAPFPVKALDNIGKFGIDALVYSAIPTLNAFKGAGAGAKVGNYLVNNGAVNAGIGSLEALKEDKNALAGAEVGGISGLVLPPALKAVGSVGNKVVEPAKWILTDLIPQRIGRIKPDTLKQVIKADSKALDLSKEEADRLALDTTERFRNSYNRLLNEKGNNVGNLLNELPEHEFASKDLADDITSILNNYSLSKNPDKNPAINATKRELATIQDLLGIKGPEETQNILNKYIDSVKPASSYGNVKNKEMEEEAFDILSKVTGKSKIWLKSQLNSDSFGKGVGARKNFIDNLVRNYSSDNLTARYPELINNSKYYNKSNFGDVGAEEEILDRVYRDIANKEFKPYEAKSAAEEMYNSMDNDYLNILKNLKENPNAQGYDNAYSGLEDMYNKYDDEDAIRYYFDKVTQDIDNVDRIVNPKVNAKELYDINKNISDLVKWGDENSKTKNDVLEQIYGAYANKISDLSPALKQANKEFSDLRNLSSGKSRLKNILYDSANLENATSALKNYKSTNDNIFELENQLMNELKEKPFLKDIDDVNAALDLSNTRTTGDSWFANLATGATKPVLKAIREINKSGIPKKVESIKNFFKPLEKEKLITPVIIKSSVPLLQGGVEENVYLDK